jgi:hypothetical protein
MSGPLSCPHCGRAVTVTQARGRDPVTTHELPLCALWKGSQRRQTLVVRRAKAAKPVGRPAQRSVQGRASRPRAEGRRS